LESVYYTLLRDSGVEIVSAKAYLKEAHTVGFSEGNAVTAERILIATGGIPFIPEFSGNNLAIVSDHAFDLPEQPAHIVIQGGGYIAWQPFSFGLLNEPR
jgi:glutathione reductase (NADPH)